MTIKTKIHNSFQRTSKYCTSGPKFGGGGHLPSLPDASYGPDCSTNPYKIGGTCTDEVSNYKYSSVRGYIGYNCSIGTSVSQRAYFVFIN